MIRKDSRLCHKDSRLAEQNVHNQTYLTINTITKSNTMFKLNPHQMVQIHIEWYHQLVF